MEELIFEIDLGQFAKRIASKNARERIETIESVRDLSRKSIKAKEILSMLISALDSEQDPQIISRLTKLIGKLGDSTVILLLKKFLWHPDNRVVANTLEGLGCIYSLDIIPIVTPFLNSPDNRIKANAARALYSLNSSMALTKLAEMTNSDEVFFRDSAAFILASIADAQCQDMLIELILKETDMEILKKSISTLCNRGDEITIEKLHKFIKQYPDHPKCKILSEIVGTVCERLKAQIASVKNINKISDFMKLNEIYTNGSNKEKEQVCLRLFDIGDESSLPLLKRATNDEDNSIRYAAKKAINNIFCKLANKNRTPSFTDVTKPAAPHSSSVKEHDPRSSRTAAPAKKDSAIDFSDIIAIVERPEAKGGEPPKQLEEIDMAFLVLDLSNSNPALRAEAVSKLLYADKDTRGVKEAVKYLVERLHVESEPQVKSQILRVIGTLGSKTEMAILKKYAEDEMLDYRIRANALEGLGCIDEAEVFDIISPFLKHSDNRVKANAVIAAWKRNPDLTFNAISDMIRSSNIAMRDSAAYGLLMLKSHDRRIINLMLELFIRETTTDIILKLTQGLSILGDEQILTDMKKMLPNASALKKPYINKIIDMIQQKFTSLNNINTQELAREKGHDIKDFDMQFEEYVSSQPKPETRSASCETPDHPPANQAKEINRYEKTDGTQAPLRSIEAHLFELNHPDEKIRLNAINAITHYLTIGLPHDNFNQVEMMLTLALNDASLKVRKEAFEAYQLIQTHRAVIIKGKKTPAEGDN